MMDVRFCNMEGSLRVFCGNHIPEDAVKEINDKYWAITVSLELVNFPLALPGTKVWKAIQARKAAMKWLELAAHKSKIAVANGAEPECMLERWVHAIHDPAYKGRKDFSDLEMAMVVFSFLFASQDAMSSGLIYGFQHLADHPEVLAKVREEQERVRKGNYEKPLTYEMMEEMVYLHAVVKESLRFHPPVTMVCLAKFAKPLSDHRIAKFVCLCRFLIKSLVHSLLRKVTQSQTTAWLSRHCIRLCKTLKSIPILTNLFLSDGWTLMAMQIRTLKITLCMAAVHIVALVRSMQTCI